jgi:RecA/RadA recombinase
MRTKMQAPFLNLLTKRWNKIGYNTNGIVIYISQLRVNPKMMFGNPHYIPGGKGIVYYTSIIATVDKAPRGGRLLNAEGEAVGIVKNIKNKVGHGSVEGARCGFKASFTEFDWRFTTAQRVIKEMERQAQRKSDD